MNHLCENCNNLFEIEKHQKDYVAIGQTDHIVIVMGTGKNMVYKGDMNREYALCPKCGFMEHQFSAEARDQEEEGSYEPVA